MIPISKPYLNEEEVNSVKEVILSGWVTQGPKVAEFEKQFAQYTGAKFATAVSSGTTALHLALKAAGVKPGNIVVTVSHSFIATANCVRYCIAEPAFVDIDPDTLNMDPELLQRFINEECIEKDGRLYYKKANNIAKGESPLQYLDKSSKEFGAISAVLVAHQIGMPADMKTLKGITNKYNLKLVEDAACAIGSEVKINESSGFERIGKPHSDIACFSFHPRKIITTGDGGMITTNKEEYDRLFKIERQHSMSKSASERHNSSKIATPDFLSSSFNYRMTDIQAAVGIQQLAKLPEILEKRHQLDSHYRNYMNDIDWLKLPYQPEYAKSNWQSYAVRVLNNAPVSRDDIILKLIDNKISAGVGIMNAHQYIPYNNSCFSLLESEKAREEVILLPFYQDIEEETVSKISTILRQL